MYKTITVDDITVYISEQLAHAQVLEPIEVLGTLGEPYKYTYHDYLGNLIYGYPSPHSGPTTVDCEHTLASYTGLTESYNYCTKCDHKEEV